MCAIATVVEGHGEVESVPILLRRYAAIVNPAIALTCPQPIRIGRNKLVKNGELERAVKLATYKAGAVLVLIDADDDCPAQLGRALLLRAREIDPNSAVVLAKSEFESWFVAAAVSLRGVHGLRADLTPPRNIEGIRDAKGWLSDNMANPRIAYSPTADQAGLAAQFDLAEARRSSPSFDKFLRELDRLFARLGC